MRCGAVLLCALLAACAPAPTPTSTAAPTAAEPTATHASKQIAPPATATHDMSQLPPLTAAALPAVQQAGQPAQTDAAWLTATAIVAAATVQARGAAAQAAVSPAACAPSAFSASLDALAAQARSALANAGLEPSAVTVTSAGIAGASSDCAALQPLYTTLAVALPAEEANARAGLVAQALAALATALDPASLPGAHPPLLALTFSADDQPPAALVAPYRAALEAYAAGLRGPALLAALGAGGSP